MRSEVKVRDKRSTCYSKIGTVGKIIGWCLNKRNIACMMVT
jgi:hypothetical protein